MTVKKLAQTNVSNVMETDYQKIGPDSTVTEAIGIMKKYEQYELPIVTEKNAVVGLLCYNSLIKSGRVPMNEKVGNLQIHTPELKSSDNLSRAAELLLTTDHRLLPVVENKKIAGIIRRLKIVDISSDISEWKKMKVSELMHKPVESISEDSRLTEARTKLRKLDIRTMPVVDESGKLQGMIGVTDIISHLRPKSRAQMGNLSGEKIHFDPKIKEVMVEDPQFVSTNATVNHVIDLMQKKKISTVIVADKKAPVGVITRFDILEHIISEGREKKGVFINISGMSHEDPHVVEAIFDVLNNAMNKVNKIFTPRVLNIHLHTYNEEGNEAKYSVNMRLTTEKYLFLSKSVAWDIFRAFHDGAENLYSQVVKKKDIVKDHKNHR